MATFPLKHRPTASYKERPRAFGCPRDGGKRKHAGCDLYAPVGTPVFAVADGTVVLGPYPFYDGVYATEIHHPGIGTVRYGEIQNDDLGLGLSHPGGVSAKTVRAGATVVAGQQIGVVGKMKTVTQSMLHFELFSGEAKGPLTVRGSGPYSRRSDLKDPTEFLDSCVAEG